MSTLQTLRRTGRTTRMLEAAVEACYVGPVLVVFSTVEQACQAGRLFRDLDIPDARARVVSPFLPERYTGLSARRPRSRDHPGRVVFIDPHALELSYGGVIDLYHAWDPPLSLAAPFPPLELARPLHPHRKIIL
jgi:hypothetical protein